MRYQKEFEYIYDTIEKLHVTITKPKWGIINSGWKWFG